MAFLDNSGDIILSAVLTDLGRKRLANGNFKITKFALGDDEINYRLYNINHPSGSAYYDLEILQTPVLDAVTAENSSINYGLLSITNNNLLYLPSLVVNEKLDHGLYSSGSVYNIAANAETYNILTGRASGTTRILDDNLIAHSSQTDRVLYFESGVDTLDEQANAAARHNLITSLNMLDLQFDVEARNAFISSVAQLADNTAVSKPADSDTVISQPTKVSYDVSGVRSQGLSGHSIYSCRGVNNYLYEPASSTTSIDMSALKGPRGSLGGIGFKVHTRLTRESTVAGTPVMYTRFGRVAQTLFGGSQKFDYIDTTVYVQGRSSTATMQLPIRILRYAGT